MIYAALGAHLATNVVELIEGNTLFIHQAPFDRELLGLFRDNPTGISINGEIPTERSGTFQFILRGKSHATINAIIRKVMTALTINGLIIGAVNIKSCRPTMEPLSYQLSAGNLREISVNFSVNYGIVQ